jgi:hypothetical protein
MDAVANTFTSKGCRPGSNHRKNGGYLATATADRRRPRCPLLVKLPGFSQAAAVSRARMSPESRARAEGKAKEMLAEMPLTS